MHSPRVYFNNIGSICTDSMRHGNGLSALLLLTRAAKSSAAKSIKHAPWKAGLTRTRKVIRDSVQSSAGLLKVHIFRCFQKISLILCNSDRITFIIKLQTSCGALVTL